MHVHDASSSYIPLYLSLAFFAIYLFCYLFKPAIITPPTHRKLVPSHHVEIQFWFLKRVEKEALLNRTTVSGALCHSRRNTARHPDRGNNSSISTLSSTSSSSLQAKVLDGGDPADHEFGAYDGEADGDYQNGDQTDDDNRRNDDAGTEDDDQEERDHERAANMVMLRHRGAAGPAPMTCTTTSSDARDKDKDNRKKPHPFLREESDKSFLWSRGGWSSTGGSSDPAPNLECGWQGVFRKYHQLERNWKQGNCAVKTLVSRRRVYCILFSEEKQLLWSGNAKGAVACVSCVCRVCARCGPVQKGALRATYPHPPLSRHTGTIKRLDLIHYGPLQETKAHDSAINCLQTLENCNSSWDDDDIARFSRRLGY